MDSTHKEDVSIMIQWRVREGSEELRLGVKFKNSFLPHPSKWPRIFPIFLGFQEV
jgi:hypothetical protein